MKKEEINLPIFPIRLYLFTKKFRGFIFDFEGSNLEGVAQINKGFGAKPTIYITIYQSLWDRCLNFLGITS